MSSVVNGVAASMGISPSQVEVIGLRSGSIIVDLKFDLASLGNGEAAAAAVTQCVTDIQTDFTSVFPNITAQFGVRGISRCRG